MALAPAMVAALVVIVATKVRVTTPVRLELTTKSVSFRVGGDTSVALTDNSVEFSRLAIERCDTVSFPPLSLGTVGAPTVVSKDSMVALVFQCDPRVPGARVILQTTSPAALGLLGRVVAERGDRVSVSVTSMTPLGFRMEMSRDLPFDVSLERDVPFDITAEFADVQGATQAVDASGVWRVRAIVPSSAASRLVQVRSSQGISIAVDVAGDAAHAAPFRDDRPIPVDDISVFERSAADDALVSTAIEGAVTYPGTSAKSVTIAKGEPVRLRSRSGFVLQGLRVDRSMAGLRFTLEGDAVELSTNGQDRRAVALDRVVTDRARGVMGVIAVLASQLIWLRDLWWPGRKSRR